MKRVLLASFLSLTTINQAANAGDASDDYEGDNVRYLQTQQNDNYGEIIDSISGELGYETIDAVIPGDNGMDIVISRSHSTSERVWGFKSSSAAMVNWHFEIPRISITTTPWGITRGWQPEQFDDAIDVVDSTRTGICNDPYPGKGRSYQNDGGNIAKKYWAGMKLKIPGQPAQLLLENTDTASGRYPSSTKWVTTSDWIVSCTTDGMGFVVKSPRGITYTMDVLKAFYNYFGVETGWDTGKNTLFTSKVEDVHGNTISYQYEGGGNFSELRDRNDRLITKYLLPGFSQKLTKISRNDKSGTQVVEFDYGSDEFYGYRSIDKITVNGRVWQYKYALDDHTGVIERYLTKVIRPDAKEWKYKYEGEKSYRNETPGLVAQYEGPNRLTQVKLPSGGTIDYSYKVFNSIPHDPYDEYERLHTKTVKDGSIEIDKWVFDYKDNPSDTVKVMIDKGLDKEIQIYKNDESFQHGRLISQTLKRFNSSGVELESKVTEYKYAELAEIGSFTFENYPKDIPDSLTRKVKLTQQKITQDGNAYTTNYLTHDLYGRPTKIQETFGSKSKYTKLGYHDEKDNWILGLPTTIKVSNNNSLYTTVSETIYHDETTADGAYDGLGLPYEQKEFGRWVKRFTQYSGEGNLEKEEYNVARTVGDGNRFTQYSNYKRGTPQTITVPALVGEGSISKTQVVDNNGWLTRETDFEGVITNYKYDSLGRVKSIDYAKDTVENIDWQDVLYTWGEDEGGDQTRTVKRCVLNTEATSCLETAKLTQVETYDGLLRLTKLSETDGTTTRYQNYKYNKYNQQTFVSHWGSSAGETKGITSIFDGLRRLESVSTSGLGKIEYDYLSGNKIKVTDEVSTGESNTTTTTYLAYGIPSYEQAIRIESPENVTTSISIDVLGLINRVTQYGFQKDGVTIATQSEYRLYDSYKQLCMVKRKDVGNTLYNKNALGEANWMAQGVSDTACTATKPVDTAINYTLDNLGNIKSINYPDDDSADVSYVRDDSGNVLTLTAGTVVHTYSYNNQNLLEGESFTIDSEKTLTVDYGYTSMMHRDFIIYPDGTNIFSKPNAFGQPSEVKSYNGETLADTFASSVKYYLSGQLDSFTYGNDITHKTTLDTSSLLPLQLKDLLPGILPSDADEIIMDLAYTYDYNANIKTITDAQNPNYSLTDLSYDGLDRLTGTTGAAGIGSSAISYDSLGNITGYSSKNSVLDYSYDYSKNRLSSVSGTGSQSKNYTSFAYDTRGNITNNSHKALEFNRANQLYQSGSNTYLYDGFNRRVKQTDAKGTSYSMYSQDGTLLYRETDVTNGLGNAINYIYLGKKLIAKTMAKEPSTNSRKHYKPYGATIETPKDDVGFAGHKFDTDLGLSYMQARYYDPVIGRFYSNDPKGFSNVHTFNRYTYANNNPYKYVDPDGRAAKFLKAAYNVVRNASKNGWDFKKAGKEEIVNFVDNATTLADGQFTADDVYAAIDILTGFGKEATRIVNGIENLRNAKNIRVRNVKDARNILDNMPELRPGPGGNVMPGVKDRGNTYRGDLIRNSDPKSPKIHDEGQHADEPHFNIRIRDNEGVRQTPAIFFDN